MSGAIRSSLDRLLTTTPGEPMWKLKLRAISERGIAVIDLGQVSNRDWAFSQWARTEAARQAIAEKRKG